MNKSVDKTTLSLLVCVIILITISIVIYADETVIESEFNMTNLGFKLDDINYSVDISLMTRNVHIYSKYNSVLLEEYDCESAGYYNFCFDGFNWEDFDIYTTASITVIKYDCFNYTNEEKENVCRLHVGENCTKDTECLSNKCSHGLCTYKEPICGDGYCDPEDCEEDCPVDDVSDVNETEVNITEELNESIANETASTETVKIINLDEVEEESDWVQQFKIYFIVIGAIALIIVMFWFVKKHKDEEPEPAKIGEPGKKDKPKKEKKPPVDDKDLAFEKA